MKKFFNSFLNLVPHSGNIFLSSALIFGLVPWPFSKVEAPQLEKKVEVIAHAEAAEIPLAHIFFGRPALAATEDKLIAQKMDFVSTRKAFPASMAVIKKHEKTIKDTAFKMGVPQDVAIGVALLENGGSETAVSKAGALGVFQLMPGTARALGLTVNKKLDDRRDPKKNITAGITYLKQNYDRFGDWGLATWAYHAGEGNVAKALKLYAKEKHGIALVGLKETSKLRDYVLKYDININKLLSSAAVKTLTKKLNDDSAGYPYKVIATANLFKEGKKASAAIPGEIVRSR
jgi:hypothetical protein